MGYGASVYNLFSNPTSSTRFSQAMRGARVNFNAEVWGNINGFMQANRHVPKAHERESLVSRNIIRVCIGYFSDRRLGLKNNNKYTQ